MATTTNFGWETPDDTDLVKDGAAAIRTALGGVDTSFVDLKGGTTGQILAKNSATDLDFVWAASAASGLTKISDNSFSGVSAVSINNNFTSTYRNYKIILQITSASATANLRMRFRTSGTDNTSSTYNSVIAGFRFDGSQYTPGGNNQDKFFFGDLNSTSVDAYFSADIIAPQLAERTGVLGISVGRDATGGFAGTGGGYFANTTQFDGLTWYPASGSISGRLLVFGYLND